MLEDANDLRSRILPLAVVISDRAEEIELAREIPDDLVQALKAAGVFRMCTARSRGGLELPLPDALEVIQNLARMDGSIGWTAMIACAGSLFLSLLPQETYDRVYSEGPDATIAGSVQPAGKAERAKDGWYISGRWPFVSGCSHADWMAGFCIMMDDGTPIVNGDGTSLVRGFVQPARDWSIEDTWHVAGLAGTGSHHIVLKDSFVPNKNFFSDEGESCLSGALYKSVLESSILVHNAFAVGVAEGALADIVTLANGGRQQLHAKTAMSDSEVLRYELGRAAAALNAVKAFHLSEAARHWGSLLSEKQFDRGYLLRVHQGAAWINEVCTQIVDACFALGGGEVVYNHSPLQRRLRDIHVAGQHYAVQRRHYVSAGRLQLEQA
ncbi:hypothetical protein MA20_34930 [Bradyrhizobium japonicum]|uniref:Uncharacterized protein n=1 Tax=Bradyrhizobium japonicum TaxID=375 RepID=A0A0A3XPZ8_BRAJP|nr:acyl-CoA dehydrogenase family protein [Bradyrhizobium japonicum]KGT75236.1 hypothetical protein MA20_34930 [Bradyrhizobium japonicum]